MCWTQAVGRHKAVGVEASCSRRGMPVWGRRGPRCLPTQEPLCDRLSPLLRINIFTWARHTNGYLGWLDFVRWWWWLPKANNEGTVVRLIVCVKPGVRCVVSPVTGLLHLCPDILVTDWCSISLVLLIVICIDLTFLILSLRRHVWCGFRRNDLYLLLAIKSNNIHHFLVLWYEHCTSSVLELIY